MENDLAENILRDVPTDANWPRNLQQYKPLVLKMAALKGQSAVTLCEPLKAHLTARQIAFGKDVAERVVRPGRDEHAADIIDISVAVVDPERRYAFFAANTVSGWLAGAGQTFYLQRVDDHNWKVIKTETGWIS